MVGNAFSGNHQSKEHGLLLYLPPELTLALAKVQVDHKLSRSRAGLLALTEGFSKLACLGELEHQFFVDRYSMKLSGTAECAAEALAKPHSLVDVEKQNDIQKLEADFSNVLSQWQSMKVKAQQYWLKKAEANKGKVPNAQLVLDLAQGAVHA